MSRFFIIVSILIVATGTIIAGRPARVADEGGATKVAHAQTSILVSDTPVLEETTPASGWYKIPYFPQNQPHCAADLLASVCCLEAYVPVSAVDNACQLSTTRVVRVVRSPFGVSSCCGCSHEFCVHITSSTPVVHTLPPGACTLVVLECYNSCVDCLSDL